MRISPADRIATRSWHLEISAVLLRVAIRAQNVIMASCISCDTINGRQVPQLVIENDYTLTGTHEGTVRVKAGTFHLAGTIKGSLDIGSGVIATISGTQKGSVAVASDASLTVQGAIEGSTSLELGATVIIAPHGKLAGSLKNNGLVVVRGVFGGPQSGSGQLCLEGEGYIKQPRLVNGAYYYEW